MKTICAILKGICKIISNQQHMKDGLNLLIKRMIGRKRILLDIKIRD